MNQLPKPVRLISTKGVRFAVHDQAVLHRVELGSSSGCAGGWFLRSVPVTGWHANAFYGQGIRIGSCLLQVPPTRACGLLHHC